MDRLLVFRREYLVCIMDDFGCCVIRTGDEALSPGRRQRFRALKSEIDVAMRGLIEESAADGLICTDDVRLTAFSLAGALNWTARWYNPGGQNTSQGARKFG
jgi:hypothetical protein